MPSMRRMRIFGVIVVSIVVYTLYLTGNARQARSMDFYETTKQAMNHPHGGSPASHKLGGGDEDEKLAIAMAGRLKDAEVLAKEKANAKAPSKQDVIDKHIEKEKTENAKKPAVNDVSDKQGEERTVAGRKKYPIEDGKEKPVKEEQTLEDKDVEAELNTILRKSPIIIFSKSYCPYSKKAKHILLDKYSIIPAPFVVELDQHPQGALLQAKLATMTGRRTVPNILVTGKSIGGGDDIAEMDQQKTLVAKLKTMGGKRMVEVKEKTA